MHIPQKEQKEQSSNQQQPQQTSNKCVTVVVFGASGDLAKKKTFPALFKLFKNDQLPASTRIIGFARSKMSQDEFLKRVTEHCKVGDSDKPKMDKFEQLCTYLAAEGGYEDDKAYQELKKVFEEYESGDKGSERERLFYLALPPTQFATVAKMIKENVYGGLDVTHRIVVEKPFGRDLESSNELSEQLSKLWTEDEIFRIDHYLGKEMVKNILVLRFANVFFNGVWNRHYIKNVQITFKETFGTEGRGGYFDEYGIVRDVLQNHLLQLLSIMAMERPVTLGSEDVRDEKVKVLRCIKPVEAKNVLVGQYTKSADGKQPGYLNDDTVPKDSQTPTYAAMVLYIDNDRWADVPFIMKAGKTLDETKTEIRIQFCDVPGKLFSDVSRNELVIRVQPNEAVYMKMMNKEPGLAMKTVISELDLSYKTRFEDKNIPDAYEALLLDILNSGDHSNFVRVDELEAAWKIFTPILHTLDKGGEIDVEKYQRGGRGPKSADDFVKRYGFQRHQQEYTWSPHKM